MCPKSQTLLEVHIIKGWLLFAVQILHKVKIK